MLVLYKNLFKVDLLGNLQNAKNPVSLSIFSVFEEVYYNTSRKNALSEFHLIRHIF